MGVFQVSMYIIVLFMALPLNTYCLRWDTELEAHVKREQKVKITPTMTKNKRLLKLVEQKFLNFMGLSGKPDRKLKDKVEVPDHLWKLYYKWLDDNYEDYDKNNADTARVLYHDVAKDYVSHSPRSATVNLHFNLDGIHQREKLHRAELVLFTEKHSLKPDVRKVGHINIYKQNTESNKEDLLVVGKVKNKKLGHVRIDVTPTIHSWINKSAGDTSLLVELSQYDSFQNRHVHLRRRRDISSHEWHKKRPVLIVYTQSDVTASRKPRMKRGVHKYRQEGHLKRINKTFYRVRKEICRMRPFRLEFKDVGWDEWILAPTGYGINYCSGVCPKPLGPHYNTTNHAVIQNSVLSLKRNLVPPLCCIPTSLKDQTFLYLDNFGNLLLKHPVQMTALGCGCR